MNALLLALTLASGGLELSADSLVLTPGSRTLVATGSVVARSGSVEVQATRADAVYLQEGGRRTLDTLALTGPVNAVRRSDGATAKGERAHWKREDARLVLEGAPELRRGEDQLLGTRILFGTDDDALDVEEPDVTLRNGRSEPVFIQAEALALSPGGDKLRFERQVQMREGGLVVSAQRADARLDGEGDDKALGHLTLTGQVLARRDRQTGRAARADWDPESGDLVLTGKPVVSEEGQSITGERIVIDGASGRARVEKATVKIRREK